MISVIITTYAPRNGELPQIRVKSLTDEAFSTAARALGGTWTDSWWFKGVPLADVQAAALAAYGTTGPTEQDITEMYAQLDTVCHRAADAAAPYLDKPVAREITYNGNVEEIGGWERADAALTPLLPHPDGDRRYTAVCTALRTLTRPGLTEAGYRRHLRAAARPGISEENRMQSLAKADELLYDAARALETALAVLADLDEA